MAKRSGRTSRWLIVDVLLLGALPFSVAFADDPPAGAAAASSTVIDDGVGAMGTEDGLDLYLDVSVNRAPAKLVHFLWRGEALWIRASALRQLGFILPAATPDPLRVDSLAQVHVDYDKQRQKVAIEAPLQLLNLPQTVLNAPEQASAQAVSTPGMLVNYDFYAHMDRDVQSSVSALTQWRLFGSWGVFDTSELLQIDGDHGDFRGHSMRLDTSWTLSFPQRMLSLRVGDTLTDFLSWSRATRIGGIQIGTDFSLQPYRVTAPLPAFFGSATLPSDVELYVNGVKQYSGQVPAGPFQLNTIPNINGAGNAQVVLTDALGRATTLNFSLYNTHQLLAAGLSDWSAELGVVRENYGIESFDYAGKPVASATWRRGVNDSFTAEAHAEATAGLANGGLGGAWQIGPIGVVSAAFAHSGYRGSNGSQASLGYSWTDSRFSVDVGGIRSFGDYRDTASLYGAPAARLSGHASFGYNDRAFGSFGIGYLHLQYPQKAATHYATGYWFKSVSQRMSLSFNLNQNLDQSRDRSVFLGFTLALAERTTLSAGLQRQSGENLLTLNANQALPTEGGFGWRAQANASARSSSGTAEIDYLGRYGQLDAGVNAFAGNAYAYAGATGSVVLMGGHVYAARRIDEAFGLVSTDGVAGVPVKLENRPIGTTDDNGMLLVTPLHAYQNNQLAIDPLQLPADVRIDRVKAVAVPGDRAGTLVHFGITPVRAASVILVDADSKPLPVGAEARLLGKADAPAFVGFDGVVYLDALDQENTLEVQTRSGKCRARFEYRNQAGGVPEIGPLTCRPESVP